jgi:hypothetical protein
MSASQASFKSDNFVNSIFGLGKKGLWYGNRDSHFYFGRLLLSILGGGFEARGLKFDSSYGSPCDCFYRRIGFIVIGILISGNNTETIESEPQDQSGPVEFTIQSELNEDAISEQIAILLDGKIVGTLTASQQHPESMITVSVPQEGSYSYSVDGSIIYDIDGTEQAYT